MPELLVTCSSFLYSNLQYTSSPEFDSLRALHGVPKNGPRHDRHKRHILAKPLTSLSLLTSGQNVPVTFYAEAKCPCHFLSCYECKGNNGSVTTSLFRGT